MPRRIRRFASTTSRNLRLEQPWSAGQTAGSAVMRMRGVWSGSVSTGCDLPSHTVEYSIKSGTTGTPARHATSNAVRPKRCKPAAGERVPSGKISTWKPSRMRSDAASTTCAASSGSAAPSKKRAPSSNGRHQRRRYRAGLTAVVTSGSAPISAVTSKKPGWFATSTAPLAGSSPASSRGLKSSSADQRNRSCISLNARRMMACRRRARRRGSRAGILCSSANAPYPNGATQAYNSKIASRSTSRSAFFTYSSRSPPSPGGVHRLWVCWFAR